MDLSSQRQYIQRAINVKYSFSATTQQTIYTAPTGGDFDFVIVKSFLACDHGNQQTNLDVSITDTGSTEFFIYKQKNIAAHATEELVTNAGIVLLQGEILKAQVNHANIDLVLSIIEYGKGD
jgi:hypothetical protein|tara:strand:- start:99 stop:464 length:366 start_codon:yes stop_codon:yes gene_type:complete